MAAFFRKYWWGLGFVLLLWLGGYYYAIKSNQDAFETLFRTPVVGKIQALETTNKGFAVRVTLTDFHRYRFFPAKQEGGASGFMAMAVVGDSLRKRSLSDTLVLVKKNRVMRYTFKKVLY
ncbi:hypothetical protein [Hymenobacter sp. UYCo722]|uniref:hypothetical protein n=1 Tax=Hymenobacter sp. UYCo722 TaxID=3156335 RepID=UPI003396BDD7